MVLDSFRNGNRYSGEKLTTTLLIRTSLTASGLPDADDDADDDDTDMENILTEQDDAKKHAGSISLLSLNEEREMALEAPDTWAAATVA